MIMGDDFSNGHPLPPNVGYFSTVKEGLRLHAHFPLDRAGQTLHAVVRHPGWKRGAMFNFDLDMNWAQKGFFVLSHEYRRSERDIFYHWLFKKKKVTGTYLTDAELSLDVLRETAGDAGYDIYRDIGLAGISLGGKIATLQHRDNGVRTVGRVAIAPYDGPFEGEAKPNCLFFDGTHDRIANNKRNAQLMFNSAPKSKGIYTVQGVGHDVLCGTASSEVTTDTRRYMGDASGAWLDAFVRGQRHRLGHLQQKIYPRMETPKFVV